MKHVPVTPPVKRGGVVMSDTTILYEELTSQGGVIKLSRWPEGYVLWYHGQIVFKSWDLPANHLERREPPDASPPPKS